MKDEPTFTFQPIGVIHSPFPEAKGTPIQSVFAQDAEGTVEVFEPFAEGMRDVQMFSHIYLIYPFNRAASKALTVVPFLDDEEHGIFATRAPCRPNAIGLSIVRVISRDANVLRVADLDVVDGTPLLDIKPYIPLFDSHPAARPGWVTDPHRRPARHGADERFA